MDRFLEWLKTGLIAVVPAAVVSYLGALAVPFGLLLAANIVDYVSGIMAAPQRGQQRESYKGWQGIAKKVCMWLLVVVGVLADACLGYAAATLGWEVPFSFMAGCLVCVWQLANELMSVVENIADMGVPVPGFLRKLIEWVRKKAAPEDKAMADNVEDGKE